MRGNQARTQQQKDAEASNAITAVQAHLRGRQSRKSLQAAHKAEVKAKHEAAAKPAAGGPKAMDDERAATVMQAGQRGYFGRRRSSREAEAATVVQARMRGKNARAALAEGSFKAGGKGSSKQKSFDKSRSRRNPFEKILRTKARVAQSMSDRVVNARMKMTMKASRMLLTGWIDGAAEVDMWSTPEEIAAGKEMWMNLLNWCVARMKAKELEVKGIGSARLRAVIHRDEEPESWPGPPPVCIALDEEHSVLEVLLQPLRWLRAKALYALLPGDKDIWYFITRERKGLLFHFALICPFGVATVSWLLLLLAVIIVEDAYQLWNYIVSYKMYALIFWGLVPAWADHFKIYYMMTNADAEDANGQGRIAQLWATHCTPLWQTRLFQLNWLLCYVVFARLLYVHHQQLKRKRPITKLLYTDMSSDSDSSEDEGAASSTSSSPSSTSSVDHGGDEELGRKAARGRAPKARATAVEITLVMKYDLVATLLFVAIMNADLTFRIQGQHSLTDYVMTVAAVQYRYEPDEVRIFYDLALTYLALVALPFVLFACPFVGELLHQMRFTAYDQMGRLRLQMEPWQMMAKKQEEDRDHEVEERKHIKEERKHEKEEGRAQAQMRAKLHKERKALQKREKKQKKKSAATGAGATDLV